MGNQCKAVCDRWATQTAVINVDWENVEVTVSRPGGGIAEGGGVQGGGGYFHLRASLCFVVFSI